MKQPRHQKKQKGVRPVSLGLSDRVSKGLRRAKVPKKYVISTHSGVLAPTKQAARGDYQCNLPMSIHSRFVNRAKLVIAPPPATTTPDATADATPTDGKKKKKEKPKPVANKIFAIPGKPHIFDVQNIDTLPDTAHDLAYQLLSQVLPPRIDGQDLINPHKDSKNPAQFFKVDNDPAFDSVSVSPQGFLGFKIKDRYISKRLIPFLVQNDAPPLLLFESDMNYITPQKGIETTYDDRALSLITQEQQQQQNGIEDGNNTNGELNPIPLPAYPRVVTIDYASPNIAKEMHVGHIRTTAIGDALARILEYSGNTIQRYNHLGDWGTQFGMLLCHYNDLLQKGEVDIDAIKKLSTADLLVFYQTAKKRFDVDQDFVQRAKSYVVRLQGGDQECLQRWKEFCNISSKSFQSIFTRLQIDPRLLERGESFYQPFLNDVIDELLSSGVAIERDGAVLLPPPQWFEEQQKIKDGIVDIDDNNNNTTDGNNNNNNVETNDNNNNNKKKQQDTNNNKKKNDNNNDNDNENDNDDNIEDEAEEQANALIPGAVVLRKSDGGFTYGATDMAAIRLRLLGSNCWYNQEKNQPEWFATDMRYKDGQIDTLPTDWALYVVDSGQSIHFQRIFEGAGRIGWVNKGKLLAQQRKMQYFNDILNNLTTTEDEQNKNNNNNIENNKNNKTLHKIVKANIDGDCDEYAQEFVINPTLPPATTETTRTIIQKEEQNNHNNNNTTSSSLSSIEEPDLRIEHVEFGVVCGADGKRLRTRAGQQIKLTDLLDEAVHRSRVIIDNIVEKNNEQIANTTSQTKLYRQSLLQQEHIKKQLSEAIGYGSIKYSDLSKNRITDYNFDFDKMLDMQGDTAGYLLYAHARLFSLLQRVGIESQRYNKKVNFLLQQDDPTKIYEKLIDYDHPFATPINNNNNNIQQEYDSVFDVVLQHPSIMGQMLSEEAQLYLKQGGDIQKMGNIMREGLHSGLVSAALAQYNSPYVLNMDNIYYQRKKHNNDNIWKKDNNNNQQYRVDQQHLDVLTHNVATIDPSYGISLTPMAGFTSKSLELNNNNINNHKNSLLKFKEQQKKQEQQQQQQDNNPIVDVYNKMPLIAIDHPSERALALHIAQFHDAMAGTLSSLGPHIMCEYTMDLSHAFSAFYRDCAVMIPTQEQQKEQGKIIELPRPESTVEYFNTQDSRVLLTHATTITLERCLDLIGIQPTKLL